MNEVLDHKCPSCNAVLRFNPHTQNWKCEYCRNTFNLEQLKKYEDELKNRDNVNQNTQINEYLCKNCGAKIIADDNTSTTSCVYCKNTVILKNKLQGKFNPNFLIPFENTKEDAIEAFKNLKKGRILMPKEFNNPKNIEEMSGIYIPFWLYDYDTNGSVEARGTKVTSWTSGDYRYTKTDTYKVIRGGSMSFKKIPVDGSKRFLNDIMNSIEPFDYTDLKPFNYSYLSGFLSEKYDVSKEEAKMDSDLRAKNTFINQMTNDMHGYSSVTPISNEITLNNTNCSYVLLPVWMLNIKYKDKIYTFAMNGQTGRIVGNIPIDVKKAILLWVSIFIIVFVIIISIKYIGGII